MFNFSKEIRTIIYTTNYIENLNRAYRKVTKTKAVFPNDASVLKSLYLASIDVTKKWSQRIKNWDQIYNELDIIFPDRFQN